MFKYKLWYDGGFLRDSSDFEWGLYETEEEAQEAVDLAIEEYMSDYEIEDAAYDKDLFEYDIDNV